MAVEVLSYDPETDRIVPRKIVNWFDNGPTDEFLQFTVAQVWAATGGNSLPPPLTTSSGRRVAGAKPASFSRATE